MIWGIVLLALVLRLISLDQSLWLDEATSALVARDLSVDEILNSFIINDFHPPFYYIFLNYWEKVFGASEISLRMPSVLAGLGSIYTVFLIGKRLFNKKVGLIAALLLSTSGLHIYYSQEARMYSFSVFFASLAFYFFIKILRKARVGDWIGFSSSLVFLVMTSYLSSLMIPVFWVLGLVEKKDFGWWKKFLASHILLLGFGTLWLPTFLKQLGGGLGVATSIPLWWNILGKTTLKEIFLVPTKFMLGRISLFNKQMYALIVVVSGLLFAYPLLKTVKRMKKSLPLWLWLLVPIAISALVGFRIPSFSYFRLIFVLPAFYLLISVGLDNLSKKAFKPILISILMVNLISSGAYLMNSRFQREDWRGLTSFVGKEENSIVLFPANSQMEAYRYYDVNGRIAGPQGLDGSYETIWLMRYIQPIFDPEDNLRKEIEELEYTKEGEYDFNSVVVWKYTK